MSLNLKAFEACIDKIAEALCAATLLSVRAWQKDTIRLAVCLLRSTPTSLLEISWLIWSSNSFEQKESGVMKPMVLACSALVFDAAFSVISSAQAHLGHPLDDAQCSEVWAKASPNGEPISWNEAGSYIPTFMIADSNQDGMISAEEFKQACAEGRVIHPDKASTDDIGGAAKSK